MFDVMLNAREQIVAAFVPLRHWKRRAPSGTENTRMTVPLKARKQNGRDLNELW